MKTNLFRIAVLLTACVFNLSANAQRPIVTLQHGDQMSVFYGAGAFIQAMDAAERGDVITLAGGSYNAVDITKAVTIQGAGYVSDPAQLRYRTVINGDFSIKVEGEEGLSIDGIWHGGTISVDEDITQATFSKCRLSTLVFEATNTNVTIDRCRIYNLTSDAHCENLYVKNSILHGIGGHDTEDLIAVDNCNIYEARQSVTALFQNCIIRESHMSANSSVFNTAYYGGYSLKTSSVAGNYRLDWNYSDGFNASFTEGANTAFDRWDTASFTLSEYAVENYLGADGTQVGIYGGAQPFTDVPSNPQIVKKEIAKQTDENGKLKVEITVEAQP